MFEKMLPKNHCDRNIACVAPASDKNAANATAIMSRIESMPVIAKVNLEPGAEIHRFTVGWNPNVTEVASGVACRDIHAAAQSNRKMGKVAADANAFAKGLKSGAIGTSLQVVEAEMAVDEIANGFYTGPSPRRGAEGSPMVGT